VDHLLDGLGSRDVVPASCRVIQEVTGQAVKTPFSGG
jgi:hypothetical protein